MRRFVTSLTRFTNLHTPASMEQKSAKAFRSMLFIAEDNGNHLHVRLHDHRFFGELPSIIAHVNATLGVCTRGIAGCVARGAALHIPL